MLAKSPFVYSSETWFSFRVIVADTVMHFRVPIYVMTALSDHTLHVRRSALVHILPLNRLRWDFGAELAQMLISLRRFVHRRNRRNPVVIGHRSTYCLFVGSCVLTWVDSMMMVVTMRAIIEMHLNDPDSLVAEWLVRHSIVECDEWFGRWWHKAGMDFSLGIREAKKDGMMAERWLHRPSAMQ